MKKFLLILIPALLFLCYSFITSKKGNGTIKEEGLRKHVSFLASDNLVGRYAGSSGYNTAAKYVQAELKKTGLKTILVSNNKKSWFQTLYLENHKLDKDSSSLTITYGNKEIIYKAAENFILPNMGKDKKYETSGNAAFIGYGIKEPQYGWDDFRNIDLKNKWVFVIDQLPDSILKNHLKNYPADRIRSLRDGSLREMHIRQAGGIGIIRIPNKSIELAWDKIKDYFSDRTMMKIESDHSLLPEIPSMFMEAALNRAVFKEQPYDPMNLKGKYGSFDLQNIHIKLKKIYQVSPVLTDNVIAVIPGTDPVLKKEYIAVGAHLDHLKSSKDNVFNGADDNASGCAAILEIAKAVAHSVPKRSVMFLFYTGEELGLMGSRHFINNSPVPVENIKMNLNLDMIGRPDGEANQLMLTSAGKINPSLKKLILAINERTVQIPLDSTDKKSFGLRSDQASFGQKNIQNIFFSTGEHKDYHRTSDDADKIDYDFLRRVTKLSYEIIIETANNGSPDLFSKNNK